MSSAIRQTDSSQQSSDCPARPLIYWLGGWGISEQAMHAILCAEVPAADHRVLAPTQKNLAALLSVITRRYNQTRGQHSGEDHSQHYTANGITTNAEDAHRSSDSDGDSCRSSDDDVAPDIIAGYSTGAFLLLRELGKENASGTAAQEAATASPLPLLLFAPFVDFRAESGLGGRVVSTRLKLLLRRLRTAPLQAVSDFYQQAQIALPAPQQLPYAEADLIWGIEQLADSAVSTEALEHLRAAGNIAGDTATGHSLNAWIGAQDTLLEANTVASAFAHGRCHVCASASHDLTTLLRAARNSGGLPC